jgi:hypothetical protein
MNRGWFLVGHRSYLVVIVSDLDLASIVFAPLKAHTPWVVSPDRTLPFPIAFQILKPVPGRRAKVMDRLRVVDHPELAGSCPLRFVRESPVELPEIDALVPLVGEGLDHVGSV